MPRINLENPLEIQAAGMNALKETLGPIGTVRFIQMCSPGYGDYTKERQEQPEINPEEARARMREFKAKKATGAAAIILNNAN